MLLDCIVSYDVTPNQICLALLKKPATNHLVSFNPPAILRMVLIASACSPIALNPSSGPVIYGCVPQSKFLDLSKLQYLHQ